MLPLRNSRYTHASNSLSCESPTERDFKEACCECASRIESTGCHAAIQVINAGAGERKCGPRGRHPRILQLKEPPLVVPKTLCVANHAHRELKPRVFS